ncbi:hypothetical protein RBI13_18945 [Alcaligenaceae bacterium A4P071]|nr:hypothetical protein [Alcaligenaceae bacterium A4P071]
MAHCIVDSDKAVRLLFVLLEEKQWLKDGGVWAHPERPRHVEYLALRFLMQLRASNADGWGTCEKAVRKSVSTFLIDFLFKLRQPERFLGHATWPVSEDEVPWRQALQIVEHEILRTCPDIFKTASSP